MFSKSKINEPGPKQGGTSDGSNGEGAGSASGSTSGETMNKPNTSAASGSKSKPQPSMLSSDLTIVGNLRTTGRHSSRRHGSG